MVRVSLVNLINSFQLFPPNLSPMKILVYFTGLSCLLVSCQSNHISNGTNYEERGLTFLAAAVRVDPTTFRKTFSKIGGGTCLDGIPPLHPLFWNERLTSAAKFHANAMAQSNGKCFQHDTCPGYCDQFGGSCSWADRIWKFYGAAGIGEDISKGFGSSLSAIQGFIQSRGHCNILMSQSYKEIGVGFTNAHSVLDFGSKDPQNQGNQPIVVGSHLTPMAEKPVDSNLLFCVVTSTTKSPLVSM
jgi:hypothetical protein